MNRVQAEATAAEFSLLVSEPASKWKVGDVVTLAGCVGIPQQISRKNQDLLKLGSRRALRIRGTDVGWNRCEEIAMPIYMRIAKNGLPIITGDATANGHEKWIELSSAQMGTFRSIAPNGPSASTGSEIVITKSMDSASNALFRQSLNGEGATIQIDFVKSGENESTYLTFTLQNALISEYQPSRSGQGRPTESLTLNFTKITFNIHDGPDISSHAEVIMRGWDARPSTHWAAVHGSVTLSRRGPADAWRLYRVAERLGPAAQPCGEELLGGGGEGQRIFGPVEAVALIREQKIGNRDSLFRHRCRR
jgi:type VI secretion system secreted protein Hcp